MWIYLTVCISFWQSRWWTAVARKHVWKYTTSSWNMAKTTIAGMIHKLISWLITWQSDWLIPLPSDGLGDKIRQLGHVKDHADGRGGGHENSEDGFLRGPWDEAVHQVRTRPLVALHQPRHLETIVHHVEGVPGERQRHAAWRQAAWYECLQNQQCGGQILHEASFKQQPEHQAAGVRPPEGPGYREPPFLQGLQLFLLAFVAEEASSAGTLWRRTTGHDT